ncbi:MAG: antirestriction protein ArdA [Cellvibrionaceae bacterium]
MTNSPQIYIADLAAYSNGIFHGAWVDATRSINSIQEEIKSILNSSPMEMAEEYAIHDHEGFGGYTINEYDSLEHIYEIASFIAEHPDFGADLLTQLNGDTAEARQHTEDHYCGHYNSLVDFVEELTESTTTIPPHLSLYIDYDKMAWDMEMNGDIFSISSAGGGQHIFWGR